VDSGPKKLDEVLDNIQVVPFKTRYLPQLHEMLEAQEYPGYQGITSDTLPRIGYIAMLGDQPIAAGFLRRVECDIVAMLDGLCSNPMFGSIIRHRAISQVVDLLINDAKHLKIETIIAFTKDEGILKRAKGIGFKMIDERLISLDLTI
jgi:hypothetical protein